MAAFPASGLASAPHPTISGHDLGRAGSEDLHSTPQDTTPTRPSLIVTI